MAGMEVHIQKVVSQTHAAFRAGKVRTYEQRVDMLQCLDRFLVEEEEAIYDALAEDLGKVREEAMLHEHALCRAEIASVLTELKSWMAMKPVSRAMFYLLCRDTAAVKPEPYGVVTLLCPWNFPLQLALLPLIGAIAAGNCVIIKPSEVAVGCERLYRERLNKYLPVDCYPVVCGGIPETTALLRQRVDYIFYTGNTAVGRIIMRAAAEHLTPVTLELGGKCPVFIDESTDMKIAARRIIANKSINAGQVCVSHDYILCSRQVQDRFIAAAREVLKEFFGEDMQKSDCYGRIINDRHFQRLSGLLEQSSGNVAIDTGSNRSTRYMGIKVLSDVEGSDSTMKDEIFGPVLPIVPVKDLDEAIDFINSREKPLAACIYSTRQESIDQFIDLTTSGAVLANDGIINMPLQTLPFGGVGESGMGRYHGRFSFQTFSHQKAVLLRNHNMEFLNKHLRYPPYSKPGVNLTRHILYRTPGEGVFVYLKVLIVAALAFIGLVNLPSRKPR